VKIVTVGVPPNPLHAADRSSALRLRVRGWVASCWLRLVAAAVLVGVVAGLALGVAGGNRRTASAPDHRYTARFGGDPDLVITQQNGTALDVAVIDAVRQMPNGGDAFATRVRVVSDGVRRAVLTAQSVALPHRSRPSRESGRGSTSTGTSNPRTRSVDP
jgi:hypothetical protein